MKHGFPKVIGAIDGTHVKIAAPRKSPESYINRKGYYSIQLQVQKNKYIYMHVCVHLLYYINITKKLTKCNSIMVNKVIIFRLYVIQNLNFYIVILVKLVQYMT